MIIFDKMFDSVIFHDSLESSCRLWMTYDTEMMGIFEQGKRLGIESSISAFNDYEREFNNYKFYDV
jgi:hypothetical protein